MADNEKKKELADQTEMLLEPHKVPISGRFLQYFATLSGE